MPSSPPANSPNYGFLKHLEPAFVELGVQGELVFTVDPLACLFRLGLVGEWLARKRAAPVVIGLGPEEERLDVRYLLRARRLLQPDVAEIVDGLRRAGHRAVHQVAGSASERLHQMTMGAAARADRPADAGVVAPGVQAGVPSCHRLLQRTARSSFRPSSSSSGSEPPWPMRSARQPPSYPTSSARFGCTSSGTDPLQAKLAEAEAFFHEEAAAYEERLAAVQQAEIAKPAVEQQADLQVLANQATEVATQFELTAPETRELIDRQLRGAGWEAARVTLRHRRGASPQNGKKRVNSEWPNDNGRAGYAPFLGLRRVGMVEAKRRL